MVKALYRNKKHPVEEETAIIVPSQIEGHPRLGSSPNRRRGFKKNRAKAFFQSVTNGLHELREERDHLCGQ